MFKSKHSLQCNGVSYISLFVELSHTNRLLSVEHNYLSLFRYSYMFRQFTTIIRSSVQYLKVM